MINIVTNVGAWLIANATAGDKLTLTRSLALEQEFTSDELAEIDTGQLSQSFHGEVTNINVEKADENTYVNLSAKFSNTSSSALNAKTIVVMARLTSSGSKDFPIVGWSNSTPIVIPGANDPSASVLLQFKIGVQREQAENVEYTPATTPSYADLENYVTLNSKQVVTATKTFEQGLQIGTRSTGTIDYFMPRIIGTSENTSNRVSRYLSIASSHDEDECVEIALIDNNVPTRRKIVQIQADDILLNNQPVALKSDIDPIDNINHYPAYLRITYEYTGESPQSTLNIGRGAIIHKGWNSPAGFTITDVVGLGVDVGYIPDGAYIRFKLLTPISLRANETIVSMEYTPMGVYVDTMYPES